MKPASPWSLDQLTLAHPGWTFARAGEMIRADRPGFQTQMAQSETILHIALAGIERAHLQYLVRLNCDA